MVTSGAAVWSIADKTVLLTGATSGIGLEASVALARMGARMLLVGRDPGRTEAAIEAVRTRAGAAARAYLCDFSSQASIRTLAAEILANEPQLHVLVNNAGGVHKRRGLTVDGIERTFATNHLGCFLLTQLLLDRLIASAPARIVTVASIGHRRGTLAFEDLEYQRGYEIMRAYRRSKLANVLFANELARRLAGTGVTSNSVHPGAVATNIWSGAPLWAKPLIAVLWRPWFITAEAGGATVVQLVASPELAGVTGKYFEEQRPVAPAPLAEDVAVARRLWEASAALIARAAPAVRAPRTRR
jgi:retinol dehydrogenase 14